MNRKTIRTIGTLALVAMLSPMASAVDWTGVKEVGGFVGFNHYGSGNYGLDAAVQTQGVSFLYGIDQKWRLGGDLGFLLYNSGATPSTTDLGMTVAPAVYYDIVSKPSGSLYLTGRPLNFTFLNQSSPSNNGWMLDIIKAGVGIEVKVSKDFGMFFEGDVLNFGIHGAENAKTGTHFGAFLFPGLRMGAKMYFGGKA